MCRDDASLYGQTLCYSSSAVAIGKLFNVNIIYIAIACNVVLLFECCASCVVKIHVRCVYVHFLNNIKTIHFIFKCLKLEIISTEYSL